MTREVNIAKLLLKQKPTEVDGQVNPPPKAVAHLLRLSVDAGDSEHGRFANPRHAVALPSKGKE